MIDRRSFANALALSLLGAPGMNAAQTAQRLPVVGVLTPTRIFAAGGGATRRREGRPRRASASRLMSWRCAASVMSRQR